VRGAISNDRPYRNPNPEEYLLNVVVAVGATIDGHPYRDKFSEVVAEENIRLDLS
jgi:hypothetical protein